MLLATHEMAFARDVATRVCFLDGGRILESGPPEQIFSEPREERTRQFLRRVLPLTASRGKCYATRGPRGRAVVAGDPDRARVHLFRVNQARWSRARSGARLGRN